MDVEVEVVELATVPLGLVVVVAWTVVRVVEVATSSSSNAQGFAFDDEEVATSTTRTTVQATTTTKPSGTTVASSTTSTSTSTTVPLPSGAPGDSPGEWVELNIPGLPGNAYAVSVSEEALLIDAEVGDGFKLYAYMFDSESLIELPIDAGDFFGPDIDGLMAVWWEGDYNEDTGESFNEHIYAYPLPNGPKVEIVGGDRAPYYAQVAGSWVTWVEGEPWEENPEENWLERIYGVEIDFTGEPQGEPTELVHAATSWVLGDSVWTYSLSSTHLVWETATAIDAYDPGTYKMDLDSFQPLIVGNEAWRASVAGDSVVYYQDGLKVAGLATDQVRELDPLGDFPSAAPTFAAYFRSASSPDGSGYEIVARGYSGSYEQALGQPRDPPWLSAAIAVSETHVAFIGDDGVHLFEWQGPATF